MNARETLLMSAVMIYLAILTGLTLGTVVDALAVVVQR